jgi:hypothetical protein
VRDAGKNIHDEVRKEAEPQYLESSSVPWKTAYPRHAKYLNDLDQPFMESMPENVQEL